MRLCRHTRVNQSSFCIHSLLSFFFAVEDGCVQRQLCGGNHAATERMIQFGRELQTLSEQLCREYGKNTTHKKMLQVWLEPLPNTAIVSTRLRTVRSGIKSVPRISGGVPIFLVWQAKASAFPPFKISRFLCNRNKSHFP